VPPQPNEVMQRQAMKAPRQLFSLIVWCIVLVDFFFERGKGPEGPRTGVNKQFFYNTAGKTIKKRKLQPCPSDLHKGP
jgi:hypothetical protein